MPEKELNEMETSTLLDAQLKTLLTRMLKELRGRVDELSEDFNQEIGNKDGNKKHKRNSHK